MTEDWYFCSHRLDLASACVENGYDVYVLTQVNKHAETITSRNIQLIPIKFSRSFQKPWIDILTLFKIFSVYSSIKPDIVHHVALKPVLYGSLISLLQFDKKTSININAITGLGSIFISKHIGLSILRMILQKLLVFLLRCPGSHLIVQNKDDKTLFIKKYGILEANISLIRGSGVDIEKFKPKYNKEDSHSVKVMLVARVLKDKGVEEFVESVRLLKNQNIGARYILVGRLDLENPSAISLETLNKWKKEGVVEWWDECIDMPAIYHQADIIVLPSYREGLPKVLLEAASCGLPIIATDVPGCREVVIEGVNGFLVPVKNSVALAYAMEKMIKAPKLRNRFGRNGRKIVEADFSSKTIINQTLNVYQKNEIAPN